MFPIQNTVPTRYPPFVTWTVIALNFAVFLIQISLSPWELEWFLLRFALVPARYFGGLGYGQGLTPDDFVPFITMMFLHGGWLHLILNMWTLWIFGGAVEDRLGPLRYILFYLACGVLAALAHVLSSPTSVVPALGASGAVAGVLGCTMRLFPMARIVIVVPILFIPFFFEVYAFIFAGLWFVLQVLQGTIELLMPSTGGGVAWWAHIGGFIAGMLLGPLLHRPERQYRRYYADEGIYGLDARGRR